MSEGDLSINLIEGQTERISETLESDGAAIDLSGCTVALLLKDPHDEAINITGSTGIVAPPTNGQVYFDPSSSDLVANRGPYFARWKVTDGSGKVSFFTNSERERWDIWPA